MISIDLTWLINLFWTPRPKISTNLTVSVGWKWKSCYFWPFLLFQFPISLNIIPNPPPRCNVDGNCFSDGNYLKFIPFLSCFMWCWAYFAVYVCLIGSFWPFPSLWIANKLKKLNSNDFNWFNLVDQLILNTKT
jgi:hypothetical protein